MFALFVMALPCVGTIMVLVWAFTGENESRKNFFRAVIAWALLFTGFWTVVVMTGVMPELVKHLEAWLQQMK